MSDTTPTPPNYIFPTFTEKAHHLVAHHPPQDIEIAHKLDEVRFAFDDLIDRVGHLLPEGPDATRAAYQVRDACQACIAAIVLNQ